MPNFLDNLDIITSDGDVVNVLMQDRNAMALATQIASDLANEVTARTNADAALGTRIDNEALARTNADTALETAITNNSTLLNTRIDNEITARENADGALGTRIDNEAIARANADTQIINIINSLSNLDKADIRNYGGVGDGVTNDTTAFNACMADNGVVYLPIVSSSNPKNYLLSDITLSGNNTVIADKGARITYGGNGFLFTITGSNVNIEKLTVDFTNGGSFLSIANTSNTPINEFNISNIITYNAVHFIDDTASTASYVSTYIHDVECKRQSGTCLKISHSFAFLLIENLTSDMTGKSTSASYAHFVFANSQGMQLTHVEAEGGYVDGYNAQNVGFYFNNCAATWIDKCLADTCAGTGFYLESTCSYLYFSNSSASLCDGFGFLLNGSKIDMNNGYVAGRIAISGHSSDAHGINSYGTGVNINNFTVFDVDGNGIAIQSGAHLIGNCRVTNCPVGVGYTTSASGYVHDCDVSGATTKISGSGSLLYKDMFDGTQLLTNVT